jgi:hypothetical protein
MRGYIQILKYKDIIAERYGIVKSDPTMSERRRDRIGRRQRWPGGETTASVSQAACSVQNRRDAPISQIINH